jgi:hypothetical protein
MLNAKRWAIESLLQKAGEPVTSIPETTDGEDCDFFLEWDEGPPRWEIIALEETPEGFCADNRDGRIRYFRLKGVEHGPGDKPENE